MRQLASPQSKLHLMLNAKLKRRKQNVRKQRKEPKKRRLPAKNVKQDWKLKDRLPKKRLNV